MANIMQLHGEGMCKKDPRRLTIWNFEFLARHVLPVLLLRTNEKFLSEVIDIMTGISCGLGRI